MRRAHLYTPCGCQYDFCYFLTKSNAILILTLRIKMIALSDGNDGYFPSFERTLSEPVRASPLTHQRIAILWNPALTFSPSDAFLILGIRLHFSRSNRSGLVKGSLRRRSAPLTSPLRFDISTLQPNDRGQNINPIPSHNQSF